MEVPANDIAECCPTCPTCGLPTHSSSAAGGGASGVMLAGSKSLAQEWLSDYSPLLQVNARALNASSRRRYARLGALGEGPTQPCHIANLGDEVVGARVYPMERVRTEGLVSTFDDLQARIDALIEDGSRLVAQRRRDGAYGEELVEFAGFHEWRAGAFSTIAFAFGESSTHYRLLAEGCNNHEVYDANRGLGVLRAARKDIGAGFLGRLRDLVSADVFSDFLEMAGHLLDTRYKDPAAVLAGGALEAHLRSLCNRASIALDDASGPIKADRLNSELAKVPVYGKLDQKNVTAWLDLRNNAAHGRFDAYTQEQVGLMLQGIRDFIARTTPSPHS